MFVNSSKEEGLGWVDSKTGISSACRHVAAPLEHRMVMSDYVEYTSVMCLVGDLNYLACAPQAYGVVWKAIEKRTRQVLALKKCFDAFRNATDAQRTFREIMYLQALAGHDNLIRLQHVVKAENGRDIYLTFDLMGEKMHFETMQSTDRLKGVAIKG